MHRSKFTIFPESPFKTTWDSFSFFFIIIQSILIPFNICFNVTPTGKYKLMDNIIDTFFIVDVCKFI